MTKQFKEIWGKESITFYFERTGSSLNKKLNNGHQEICNACFTYNKKVFCAVQYK